MSTGRLSAVFLMLLILGSCSREGKEKDDASKKGITELSPQEFRSGLASTPEAVLIDVRRPDELAEGIINGAININYTDSTFKEKINGLDRTKPYFIYCKSGKRSAGAVGEMEKLGFENIHILEGGYTSWVDEGLDTVRP